MEEFSVKIVNYFKNNYDMTNTDLFVETSVNFFKKEENNNNDSNDNAEENFTINLGNLDYTQLTNLLKTNKKMFRDYFKFGLFKLLDKENQKLLFKEYIIPYPSLKDIISYIIEEKDLVKILI
jgi:hypothetical protein